MFHLVKSEKLTELPVNRVENKAQSLCFKTKRDTSMSFATIVSLFKSRLKTLLFAVNFQ